MYGAGWTTPPGLLHYPNGTDETLWTCGTLLQRPLCCADNDPGRSDRVHLPVRATRRHNRTSESPSGSPSNCAMMRYPHLLRMATLTRTGLVVAAVAVTGSGPALGASYVGGEDPGRDMSTATDPTSDPATGSPSPTAPSAATSPDADQQTAARADRRIGRALGLRSVRTTTVLSRWDRAPMRNGAGSRLSTVR